jgi:NAD(P)-dependent dehydrogenase (short-subunit alcohol dehydrogenase family)
MTNDQWEALFRLNLGSSLQLTRRAIPHMAEQRWGRVVMIASVAAKYPKLDILDYCASKAAMVSASKALALQFGADNVLVNAVLPGLIHTDAWDKSAGRMASFGIRADEPEAVLDSFAAEVPLQRFAHPDEVASVVLFLCSELATYVNGVALEVDGGWNSHLF